MTSVLSCYYDPWHWRGEDEAYIAELQPAWINIHQPSGRSIAIAQARSPQSLIMLRSWDIDDHNGDRKREVYADPIGAARIFIQRWDAKLAELKADLRRNGWAFDESMWYMGSINEPDPNQIDAIVAFTGEIMRLAEWRRWGVIASSVGTFSKPSENDRGWTKVKPLEKQINDGGHILMIHEYWEPKGPSFGEDAGNLAWRHRSIPMDVRILVREAGANGYIFNRYTNQDDGGWQRFVVDGNGQPDPARYAAQVEEFIIGCDERIEGVCLYMTDYHDDNWWSFDTLVAHAHLLRIKEARPRLPNPMRKKGDNIIVLPVVKNERATDKTMYVKAPNGLNIRNAPVDGKVLIAAPYGASVQVIATIDDSGWFKVVYGGFTGYSYGVYLSADKVTPEPAPVVVTPIPPPTNGALDPLILEAIVLTEAGGDGFENNRLKIRLEAHLLLGKTWGKPSAFQPYFRFDLDNILLGYFREDVRGDWVMYHADQDLEWRAFDLARRIDAAAAYRCTSMGAGQVMGFNAERVGFGTPDNMFAAFHRGELPQHVAVINYCLTDPALLDAIRQRDWDGIIRAYNGVGLEAIYAPRLIANYRKVGGVV